MDAHQLRYGFYWLVAQTVFGFAQGCSSSNSSGGAGKGTSVGGTSADNSSGTSMGGAIRPTGSSVGTGGVLSNGGTAGSFGSGSPQGGSAVTVGLGGSSGSQAAGNGGVAGELNVDCTKLLPLPLEYEIVAGPAASEDFVIRPDGMLLNIANTSGNLMSFKIGDTKSTLLVPGVATEDEAASGIGLLPDGDLAVAVGTSIVRIARTGGTSTIVSGLEYPNGLTIDRAGIIFTADQSAGTVYRIDPQTKTKTILASQLQNPNGVALSVDQRTLYVGSFGGNKLYRIDLGGVTNGASVFAEGFGSQDGSGEFDGITVDACGNVYVTEYSAAIVWRISPTGAVEKAIDLGGETSWIPNLHFGTGVGGWKADTLFVMDLGGDDRLFGLKVGVPGAAQVTM